MAKKNSKNGNRKKDKKEKKSKKRASAAKEFAPDSASYRADALEEMGPFNATITSVRQHVWDDGKSNWMLALKGHDKEVKCGKLNGRRLAKAFGDNIYDWPGRDIRVSTYESNKGTATQLKPVKGKGVEDDEVEDDDLLGDDDDLD